MKKLLFLSIIVLILSCSQAERSRYDISKSNAIKKLMEDYNRQIEFSPDSAYNSAKQALNLSQQAIIRQNEQFEIFSALGVASQKSGHYNNALEYFEDALKHTKKVDPANLAILYNYIGQTALLLGKTEQAMEYFPRAQKIYITQKDLEGQAASYRNIGSVYQHERKWKEAEELFILSLDLYKKTDNLRGQASCYNNLGGLYQEQDEYEKALEYYKKSEQYALEINHFELLLKVIYNMGLLMEEFGELELAHNEYLKALNYAKKFSNNRAIAETYYSLGRSLQRIEKADSAAYYFTKAIEISQLSNIRDVEVWALTYRAESYVKLGFYQKAIEDFALSNIKSEFLNINNQEKTRSFTEQYMQYKEDVRQELQRQRNIFLRNFALASAGAGLLLLLLTIFLIKSNRQKRKTNAILSTQRDEIEKQRDEIENQHREISESIDAASLVQNAVLPQKEYLDSILPQYFILNLPHTTVSGDFYWITNKDEYIVVAVADCTGHGACGAVVSMLGISSLNKIVSEMETPNSNLILNNLRDLIIHLLNPEGSESDTRNGMDIALLVFNTITREIEFSGAKRPLYVVHNDKLTEKNSDRMSIGVDERQNQPFTAEKFAYNNSDTIYLFSDGYTDQFDKDDKKLFKKKRFKELLQSISKKPLQEQKTILEKTHLEWRGETPQTDDILVMGIRF